jgi:hypothetical protein
MPEEIVFAKILGDESLRKMPKLFSAGGLFGPTPAAWSMYDQNSKPFKSKCVTSRMD